MHAVTFFLQFCAIQYPLFAARVHQCTPPLAPRATMALQHTPQQILAACLSITPTLLLLKYTYLRPHTSHLTPLSSLLEKQNPESGGLSGWESESNRASELKQPQSRHRSFPSPKKQPCLPVTLLATPKRIVL
mmetsp:Transcript_25858/g.65451  ORF Transcript_25858/g.65451 Transcript_25858/m.65451 type:complete len:133 (-) Transcript_25858:31-429(-)